MSTMYFWIFSYAEPATTIIAASVPVLRVLFRDAARSGGGYNSSSRMANGYLQSTNKVQIKSQIRRDPNDIDLDGDASSDRSILGGQKPVPGSISRTTEISVQYESGDAARPTGSIPEEEEYEMTSRPVHQRAGGNGQNSV